MSDEPRCPQCGAPAARQEEDAFTTCRFCGARLLLAAEPGVRHDVLLPAIAADEVPARLKGWLAAREALGRPENVASRLVFLPFWAAEDGTRLAPAAALLSEGLGAFRLPSGDRRAFGPEAVRGGDVVPAAVAREAVPFAANLVHLPFHEVTFALFGKPGRVLVDAVAGQVLALSSVPTSEARLDRVYTLLIAALFAVAFLGFFWLFRGVTARGLLLLLGAGPGLLLVARQAIVKLEET